MIDPTPKAGDYSDAISNEWEKMNFKNGINIGVRSIDYQCTQLSLPSF